MLEEKSCELKVVDEGICKKLLTYDASETDLCAEKDGSDGYQKRAKQLIIRCSHLEAKSIQADADNQRSRQGSMATTKLTTGKRKFKLLVSQFKKFDGNEWDWLSFWTQYRKVHENPDIDMADEIEYLLQSTVPGSRARLLVESF
ncbi:hypothetical protein HUJ04_012877 [Dendroctonus ponderosae]|nr:hypothetical protein HUJ04_012877 [Dendroctonus ponderosae]